MPNLTIKNLPREVHRALKRQAEQHRRSLNQEVVDILAREARRPPLDVEELIRRIRERNARLKMPAVTDEEIRAARRKAFP
jgi:antitoxin FitA